MIRRGNEDYIQRVINYRGRYYKDIESRVFVVARRYQKVYSLDALLNQLQFLTFMHKQFLPCAIFGKGLVGGEGKEELSSAYNPYCSQSNWFSHVCLSHLNETSCERYVSLIPVTLNLSLMQCKHFHNILLSSFCSYAFC